MADAPEKLIVKIEMTPEFRDEVRRIIRQELANVEKRGRPRG